jgi:pyridoxine 4-dehydrogenase
MDPELQSIFDYAVSQGVNIFDTADSYGTGTLNGRSEQLLGRFLRENTAVQAGTPVHIATKLAGYPWRVTPWNMTAACKCASIACMHTHRLQVRYPPQSMVATLLHA